MKYLHAAGHSPHLRALPFSGESWGSSKGCGQTEPRLGCASCPAARAEQRSWLLPAAP